MRRFSAKLIVVPMASGALAATAIAQTPGEAAGAPAAQPAPPTTPTAPAASSTVDVSDGQVRSFALALVEVDKIQRQYAPRIEAAGADERPALQQEANARMATAVEAQGLDAQTFNAINTSANEDPELQSKIRAEVAKVQSGEAGSR